MWPNKSPQQKLEPIRYSQAALSSSTYDAQAGEQVRNSSNENIRRFHVRDDEYTLEFINNETTTEKFDAIIDLVKSCRQFSFDTESDMRSNRLSLIQIHVISTHQKSTVVLVELNQLNRLSTFRYEKLVDIFRFIFGSDRWIYSWGEMLNELRDASDLIPQPVQATFVDLQRRFSSWYNWARTQCRVQNLVNMIDDDDDDENDALEKMYQARGCGCHKRSPYNEQQLWALDKAVMYACGLFLDKSTRMSRWSESLTSRNSSLSSREQSKMVTYAVMDVLVVSFLSQPVMCKWTFDTIKCRNEENAFEAFEPSNVKSIPRTISKKKKIKNLNLATLSKIMSKSKQDFESNSSDDEIYLSQVIQRTPQDDRRLDHVEPAEFDEPEEVDDHRLKIDDAQAGEGGEDNEDVDEDRVRRLLDNDYVDVMLVAEDDVDKRLGYDEDVDGVRVEVDNHCVVVDEVIKSPNEETRRPRRSTAAKQRRNKKRNKKQRQHRYDYATTRQFYYKIKSKMARRIVRHFDIDFKHVKKVDREGIIVIGCRDRQGLADCERLLPVNCFDRFAYERFKNSHRK